MNRKHWIAPLALTIALAGWTGAAAAEPVETTTAHFTVTSPEAGNAEFEIENPEVGDVQSFWTDSGEEVVVRYDDEGFLIQVAGDEIRVATALGGMPVLPDGANGFVFESDDEHQVILDGEGGDGQVMIWHSQEGEDGDGEPKVHVIRRDGAKVELLEEGATKVIEIPGGDDIEVIRTKDADGKMQVKVLRNGEEIDPAEFKDGEGPHGIQMMRLDGEDGASGHRVVTVRKIQGENEDQGDVEKEVKVHVEKIVDGSPGGNASGTPSSGTMIQVQIRKTVEDN